MRTSMAAAAADWADDDSERAVVRALCFCTSVARQEAWAGFPLGCWVPPRGLRRPDGWSPPVSER